MHDPYQEDQAREEEIARLQALMDELDHMPGADPVPVELAALLDAPDDWRTGRVPLADGRRMLIVLLGDGIATADDLHSYLLAAGEATVPAEGVESVQRRALPRPLAGYATDGTLVTLADWLGKGDARGVLRELRGRRVPRRASGPAARGERRLWGVAILPALLGVRSLREILPGVMVPAPMAGTASTAMGAVAPLATAAAIATGPAVLPAMDGVFGPVHHHRDVVKARILAPEELPPALPELPLTRREEGGSLQEGASAPSLGARADAEPEEVEPEEVAQPPAPTSAPSPAPTLSPAPQPGESKTPTPTPASSAEPAAEPAAGPAAEPTPAPTEGVLAPPPTLDASVKSAEPPAEDGGMQVPDAPQSSEPQVTDEPAAPVGGTPGEDADAPALFTFSWPIVQPGSPPWSGLP
ncbi:hypothetical protein E1264_17740 [Actinomadura sp. KC216]|uniref:hypothetical protein n=1 Tax=Actinomadura sp. KC216 TaxID=2530370 RepID=UPI001043CF5B|nr:hypothetical protein [Actinomadura sp. KC216]TDB86441.1 hypothetical protein E1264_17740 [Actinomadura sp. KC216]